MTAANDPKKMSCEEFQSLLPELIGTGEDITQHPHIQSCELCSALMADLQTIADAAKLLFPAVEPPEDLWSRLDEAIKKEGPTSPDGSPDGRAGNEGEALPVKRAAKDEDSGG